MNGLIAFPGRHDQIASFAPQHFREELAAQRSRIISGHFAGREDQSVTGQNFHSEVARRKLLDALDQAWGDARADSIDAVTGMAGRMECAPAKEGGFVDLAVDHAI